MIRVSAVYINIILGLWLERWCAQKQLASANYIIALFTILHLGFYFYRANSKLRPQILACLLFATLGELILSGVFSLYLYRDSLLPPFVPPGHVLLYLAGLELSRSKLFALKHVCLAIQFIAGALVLYEAIYKNSYLSTALYLLYLIAIYFGPYPKLYTSMFWMALALEYIGTYFGTWSWNANHSCLGFIANPPVAAGVFYIGLDLLTDFDYTKYINNLYLRLFFPPK